jgi:hypothetical protein
MVWIAVNGVGSGRDDVSNQLAQPPSITEDNRTSSRR